MTFKQGKQFSQAAVQDIQKMFKDEIRTRSESQKGICKYSMSIS